MAGIKFEAEGYGEFRKSLREIQSSLKVVSSEIRVTKSEFDKGDNSVTALTAKNKTLSKTIEEQKKYVDQLAKGVAGATKEFGENDKRTQDLTIQYNRAQAQLNNLEREFKDNEKAARDVARGYDDAGNKLDEFGNAAEDSGHKFEKLGGVLKGVGAVAGAIVVAAGAAAVALGKEVISAYADYEQLVGGVDTLFKDSSAKVQEYAESAYKTAGLSANEYMETVTGFSASLIQSLGGDTEKAAQYADMAITDMSDNANKMGTDMASIQNAYQGFAKQNYTMLDNLKLGYGGTKEEMKRLLADAEKISGVKYDISSYADIVEAIHVVQEEMGIAGTTALEAEETISGSINSLGAAFKNLIVGFGDADADMEKLTKNVVDAFQTVVKNITPVIENIVSALPAVVEAILPAISGMLPLLLNIATDLLRQLIDAITAALPELIPVAVEAILTITDALIDNLPLLIDAALQIVVALAEGLAESLPELIPSAVEAIITIVESLIDNIDMLVDASIAIIMAIADGLIDAMPTLLEKAPIIVAELVAAVIENAPKLLGAALELVVTLAKGIVSNIGQLVSSAGKIVTEVLATLKAGFESAFDIGKNIVQGIWKGISASASWLLGKIKEWCGSILNGIKSFFGIKSPSTVMAEVGKYMVEGLSVGMKDESGKLMETVDDISKELLSRFSGIMGVFSVSSDISGLKYDLWEATLGKGATETEKTKQRLDNLNEQAEINLQQIETTQKAYDKMVELTGDSSEESLKLQKQLLQEQLAYEKLKESIEELTAVKESAYNTDNLAKMAEQEFKLWSLENQSASDSEKLAKQAELLALKYEMQGAEISDAEEALADMVEQYGANAEESVKLQEQLLKEKIAYMELKKQIDEVNRARGFVGGKDIVPSNFLQSAQIWSSMKSVANDTGVPALTSADVGGMIATAVNAMGTISSAQPPIVIQNPLYINGKELARATVSDFRAVEASSPQVRSDRL